MGQFYEVDTTGRIKGEALLVEPASNTLFVDGGKVGVKTATPSQDFDVNGTAKIGTLNGPVLATAGVLSAYSLTSGGILYGNGTDAIQAMPVLTNGQLLIGDGSGAPTAATLTGTANRVTVTNGAGSITLSGPQDLHTAASPTFASLNLTSPLTVANGGTGVNTLTSGGILYGNGTSGIQALAVMTDGQLLIGDGSGAPTAATLTGTSNQVTVTNGAGSITLSLPQNIHSGAAPTFAGLSLSAPLTVANGGTGQTSFTTGDILYAGSAGTIAKLSDVASGNVLLSQGEGVAPAYGKVGLETHVAGILPIGSGGTAATTAINARNNLLPAQSGNAGLYLTTDGVNVSWSAPEFIVPPAGVRWMAQGDAMVYPNIVKTLMDKAGTISSVYMYVDTAPVGSNLQIDIKKNGVSIFSTKPEIGAGSNTKTVVEVFNGGQVFSAGDRFSLDITAVGSTTPGGNDLLVTLAMV